MLVVSDTTPLNYLVFTGADHVLPRLYGSILVPSQVIEELLHEDTTQSVREWAQDPPEWIQVRDGDVSLFPLLDPGEAAALALAVEIRTEALLADDMEARLVAQCLGLVTVGTVGILGVAHNGLIAGLDTAIQALHTTNFHTHDETIAAVKSTLLLHHPDDDHLQAL